MKKFVAILVAAIMLVSLVPTTMAHDISTYGHRKFILEFSGGLQNSYPSNSYVSESTGEAWSGFRFNIGTVGSGESALSYGNKADGTAMGKNEKDAVGVMTVFAGSTGNFLHNKGYLRPGNDSTFKGYQAGERVHMRGQYYFPRQASYYTEAAKGMQMALSLFDGNTTTVVNPSTSTIAGTGSIVTFAPENANGGKILLFGVLEADQTYVAENRYTVDVVLTFGNAPKLSVYVNGMPLTFENSIVEGAPENSLDLVLNKPCYGINEFAPVKIITTDLPAGDTVVITDNWLYLSIPVDGDDPVLFEPLVFDGISENDTIVLDEFKELKMLTDGVEFDECSLYINNELYSTLTASPYTFSIGSDVEPGNATFKVIAKKGASTFERTVNVILAEIYPRKAMDQNMDAYSTFLDVANGGWYSPSSRFSLSSTVPNGWFMTPEIVQDKAKKSFGKAVKFGCGPDSGESFFEGTYVPGALKFGYQALNATDKAVKGYTAEMSWQMYVDNSNMDETNADPFYLQTGQKLFGWDKTEQKMKWNVKGDPVYTEPKYQYWQSYVVDLDMSGATTKISLSIDGASIFEDRELASNIGSFNTVLWYFDPDHVLGNFVAIDEVLLTHYIPRPGFGEALFYRGETENDNLNVISPLTDTITLNMGKDLMPNMLNEYVKFYENGKELTFTDDDGVINKTSVLLYNGLLYLVPPCPLLSDTEYLVSLDKNALFADGAKIGYDQTFTFKTAKADLDVVDVTYYKNGTAVEDLDAVTFVAGDKIKAEITVCNANILDEDVYVMLLGYNGKLLTASDITLATAVAEKADNVFETAEITVADATDFSVSAAVWNGDFLPIANATIASGNQ